MPVGNWISISRPCTFKNRSLERQVPLNATRVWRNSRLGKPPQTGKVTAAKANGTKNLDRLLRNDAVGSNLGYFVCFSSVGCGPTNYDFANSVMELVCECRRADGHHGIAVQWEPIGDVRVLAEVLEDVTGFTLQRINISLQHLETILNLE